MKVHLIRLHETSSQNQVHASLRNGCPISCLSSIPAWQLFDLLQGSSFDLQQWLLLDGLRFGDVNFSVLSHDWFPLGFCPSFNRSLQVEILVLLLKQLQTNYQAQKHGTIQQIRNFVDSKHPSCRRRNKRRRLWILSHSHDASRHTFCLEQTYQKNFNRTMLFQSTRMHHDYSPGSDGKRGTPGVPSRSTEMFPQRINGSEASLWQRTLIDGRTCSLVFCLEVNEICFSVFVPVSTQCVPRLFYPTFQISFHSFQFYFSMLYGAFCSLVIPLHLWCAKLWGCHQLGRSPGVSLQPWNLSRSVI